MLFVPFQTPQAPSLVQRAESVAIKDDADLISRQCVEERDMVGGGVAWGSYGESKESCLRRARDGRDGVCDWGADEVKYD